MKEMILHSLGMRKVQTFSVILAVALSVMTLLALTMIYGGVLQGVDANEKRSGAQALVVPVEAKSTLDDSALLFTGAPAPIYFQKDIAEKIANLDGIERSTIQFYTQTLDESCCSTIGATRLIGVDLSTDWTIQPLASKELPDKLGEGNVVIGANVGSGPGTPVTLLGTTFNIYDQLAPSGTDLDNSILLDIDEARKISENSKGLSYLWQKYGNAEDLVSTVLFDYKEGVDRFRVTNSITAINGLSVIERSDVVAESQRSLEAVFAILFGVGIIMLIVTIVQLVARFYTCVWDRKSELALYRAIGASSRDLKALIGCESAITTGIGYVFGIILGIALYFGLLELLQDSSSFPFIGLAPWMVVLAAIALLCVFAILTAIAIVVPLRQSGRLDPSLAMQQGDID